MTTAEVSLHQPDQCEPWCESPDRHAQHIAEWNYGPGEKAACFRDVAEDVTNAGGHWAVTLDQIDGQTVLRGLGFELTGDEARQIGRALLAAARLQEASA